MVLCPCCEAGESKELWHGPYTVIDRVGAVTYQIQLIGSPKTLVVHRNRLKLCYGEPNNKKQPAPTSQRRERELTQTVTSNQTSPPITPGPVPKPTYADVVATHPADAGGYTTSSDEVPEDRRVIQTMNNHLRLQDHNIIANLQCQSTLRPLEVHICTIHFNVNTRFVWHLWGLIICMPCAWC